MIPARRAYSIERLELDIGTKLRVFYCFDWAGHLKPKIRAGTVGLPKSEAA